ncbi:uncharacterized protein LOC113539310 [Pangasianodon hypophthalmus]|uniref:uncharacterized protein LOC113539310 n=1 Tax=Pangasianodon hypophthalmus TaxID=310915 RepID=UPI002307AAB8|nr:uncharacterized protein LOC113539310 [Pangasianodon hypophthalmus]
MAEASISMDQGQFNCPVCLILLKDPVTTPCGHNFCKECINGFWDEEDLKGINSCPHCRETFTPRPVLRSNNVLAEVVENMKTEHQAASTVHCYAGPGDVECDSCIGRKRKAVNSCLVCQASYCEDHLQPHYQSPAFKKHKLVEACAELQEKICSQHDKLIDIYCRTDQSFICYLCMIDEHKGHDTVSTKAERTEKQNELKQKQMKFRQIMQKKWKKVQKLKQTMDSIKEHSQAAVDDSERIFTELVSTMEKKCSEVKKLIRAQEEAELSRVERLLKQLKQEIADLKRRVTELEQLSHTHDHIHFLQSFPSLCVPPGCEVSRRFTVNLSFDGVRKFLSDLKKQVEEICEEEFRKIDPRDAAVQMILPSETKSRADFLQYFINLTLDPNTAHHQLILSKRNRAVTRSKTDKLSSDNPERFDSCSQVLCKESVCGRCYWEVEWNGVGVDISVSYKDIRRKGGSIKCVFGRNSQSWSLRCSSSSVSFRHNNIKTELQGPASSRIGVCVDHSAGTLSFYSVSETMRLLHRVHTTFTQPLYPGFKICYFYSTMRLCDPNYLLTDINPDVRIYQTRRQRPVTFPVYEVFEATSVASGAQYFSDGIYWLVIQDHQERRIVHRIRLCGGIRNRRGPMNLGLSFLQGRCSLQWRATPSAPVGSWAFQSSEHQHGPSDGALPVAGGDELLPRPSRSPGTNGQPLAPLMAPQSMGKEGVGSQVRIEMGLGPWQVDRGSPVRTRPKWKRGLLREEVDRLWRIGQQLPGYSLLSIEALPPMVLPGAAVSGGHFSQFPPGNVAVPGGSLPLRSWYFIVPKKDGGLRPILDLRQLNRSVVRLKFRMLTIKQVVSQISSEDWFVTINLKDSYFHISVLPQYRKFLRFAFGGEAYQYRVLPFGPGTFTPHFHKGPVLGAPCHRVMLATDASLTGWGAAMSGHEWPFSLRTGKLLSLRAVYIPGHLDMGADILSRQGPRPGEWRLPPEVVKQIWRVFGLAQNELKQKQMKFRQIMQKKRKKVQKLKQTMDSIKEHSQAAVDDSERIFTELVSTMEKKCSEVKKLIRAQEEAELSRAERLLKQLKQEIADLKRRVTELEQLSHTHDHIHFLQSFPSLCVPPGCEVSRRFTVNLSFDGVRKFLSDLKKQVEEICEEEFRKIDPRDAAVQMILPSETKSRADFLQYFINLTLDPNTAHHQLILSEKNRAVTRSKTDKLSSDHPERFDSWAQVLCKETVCGRCYWEVEWNGMGVDISVSYKDIRRKGESNECGFGYTKQSWSLQCYSFSVCFWHNNIKTELQGPASSRIGVYVDHSAGTLSFYSVSDTMRLLHRVHTTFTQPLYPGFKICYFYSTMRLCDPN